MTTKPQKPAQDAGDNSAGGDEAVEALTGPRQVQMPKAVHEIPYAPDKSIAPGTVITDELAAKAGFDGEEFGRLLKAGAIELVDVYVS